MTSSTPQPFWQVRSEDTQGEGFPVEFRRLAEAVADGLCSESNQVRGPNDIEWLLIDEHPLLDKYVPPARRLRPKSSEEMEMDITPMIDVTFQLIIFFMITATFVVQKTLDMPDTNRVEAASTPLPTLDDIKKQYLFIELRDDGTITVDSRPVDDAADLSDILREASEMRDVVEIALDVDDDVSNGRVVQVLDAAAGAEIEQVHFTRSAKPPVALP